MITFVAFYIDITTETMDNIHKRTSTITVTEPHQFLQAMFASAKHFHPDCRQVILTDQATRFPDHPDTEIIRYDLDPQNPMLSRSTAWLNFLKQVDTHTIFVDSDILINASLAHLFEQEFDVALTHRNEKKWPVNAGINFVHGDHLDKACAFYEIWLEQFRKHYKHESIWGGDQDVLRDMFSEVDFSQTDSFTHTQNDITIQFIPCVTYNFSTVDQYGMTGHYPDKKVLHFKGRRKDQMMPYWNTYIKPQNE
jgi:hypothetical protein